MRSPDSTKTGRIAATKASALPKGPRFLPSENHPEFQGPGCRGGFPLHKPYMGGSLKCWYPTTMGFPTENDHFGVFGGYHHLRKQPHIGEDSSILRYLKWSW